MNIGDIENYYYLTYIIGQTFFNTKKSKKSQIFQKKCVKNKKINILVLKKV